MSEEVNNIINNLCDKLGYAASEITPEMAKYMIAKDVFSAIVCLAIIAVCAVIIAKLLKHYFKKLEENEYYDSPFEIIISIGCGFAIILTCVALISTGADLVGWIASPKASMVEYVLHAIGQKG